MNTQEERELKYKIQQIADLVTILQELEKQDCNDCIIKEQCQQFCINDHDAEKLSEITSVKDWGFCKLALQILKIQ